MATEKRLIDANVFFDKLEKLAELMRQGKIGEIDLNLLIASMPTVDAVEVVRCKDCKHKRHNRHADVILCDHLNGRRHLLTPMSFCSDGERRTEDG